MGSMSSSKMNGKLKRPLDYINITLQIIEHILSWPGPEVETAVKMPYLIVDSCKKVQRVYIVKDNQIVSFSFPFHVYEKTDITGVRSWHIRYRDIEVSTAVLSKCRGLYSDYEQYGDKKTYSEVASGQNLKDSDVLQAIKLFEVLMLTEPAYVRYDYAPREANGQKHPLFHFDYNFISTHHYKHGLHGRVTLSDLEDMINKDSDSWYVAKYRESVIDIRLRLKKRFGKKNKTRKKKRRRLTNGQK